MARDFGDRGSTCNSWGLLVEAAATSDHPADVYCLAGTGRKHARVKYTVEDYGPEWFKAPRHLGNRKEELGSIPC